MMFLGVAFLIDQLLDRQDYMVYKPLVKECATKIFKALKLLVWASMQENLSSGVCLQLNTEQRHRPACPSVQSEKCLCCSLIGNVATS